PTLKHKLNAYGEGRELAAPMARLQKEKQAAVTTGSAETSRPSPRDGLNGCFVLSSGTGFLAPVRVMRSIIASRQCAKRIAQASAPGCQDHTT
ncbi:MULTISPECIES: hypothetical protein, partial [unclassified Bradyrhizobium]